MQSSDRAVGVRRFSSLGIVVCALASVLPIGPPSDGGARAAPTTFYFLRGDANGDGAVDLADAITALQHLFRNGAAPPCLQAADANDDGQLDIADPIKTLLFLFVGHSPLPAPGHAIPGSDPTADALPCATPLAVTFVVGTVVRADTDAALASVAVSLGPLETITESDGRFGFKRPPLGAQTLRVDPTRIDPSLPVVEQVVEVLSETVVDVGRIMLSPDTTPPTVRITSVTDGMVITDALP